MTELSVEQKQKIKEALDRVGAKLPCPRCSNRSFVLLDGYFSQTVQTEIGGLVLGGRTVPSVVLVCGKCGYLAQHALGALGLLPEKQTVKEGEQ